MPNLFTRLSWIVTVLAFLTYISPSLQDAPSVTWISPPPPGQASDFSTNWVVAVGDNLDIAFTTSATNFDVVIWQAGVRNPYTIKSNTSETSFSWTVDTSGFNLPITPHGDITGNVCYLGVTKLDTDGDFSTSHYINITGPVLQAYYATVTTASQSTSTTSSQSSSSDSQPKNAGTYRATSTTTASITSSRATMSTTTPTTTAEANSANGQLTGGQAAGIGIGAAIGVLAVGAAVAVFLYRRVQQKNRSGTLSAYSDRTAAEAEKARAWQHLSDSTGSFGSSTAGAVYPQRGGTAGYGISPGAGVSIGATARQLQRHELGEGSALEMEAKWARELPS